MRVVNVETHMYNITNIYNSDVLNPSFSNDNQNNVLNVNNIRENMSVSDHDYVGSIINYNKNEKERKIFRIQGCNPDRFNLTKQGGDFQEFCQKTFEYKIDMSCVSEINIDTTKYKVHHFINQCAKK